jgi:hypothetical protein
VPGTLAALFLARYRGPGKGVIETVLSRGSVIVEGGEWKGKAGEGRFIKRGTFA